MSAAVFVTDPGLELVQALCFLVYSGLKDEKTFCVRRKLSLARLGCVQKSWYLSRHRLKSRIRLNADRLLELKFRGRVNECEQTISTPSIFAPKMNQLAPCPNRVPGRVQAPDLWCFVHFVLHAPL